MRLALEPYSDRLVQEMRPMWHDHAREVGYSPSEVDPSLTIYSQAQKNGNLRIYTARFGAGWESTLVGYQVFFVMRHPHRNCKEANQDLLYVDPEVRKGFVALKFMRWCDEQLRNEGVTFVYRQIRAKRNFAPVLKRMGYELTDLTFGRTL